MFFDGASSKEGARDGIIFISPTHERVPLSYKLELGECGITNNVAEYEALVLGMEAAIRMGMTLISIYGDSELVVKQVMNKCRTKHPQLHSYRNQVWDIFDNSFLDANITDVPREENRLADSLAVSSSLFHPLNLPRLCYNIEGLHRPSIPDNIKHWQVFDDDQQIQRFLAIVEEFSNMK